MIEADILRLITSLFFIIAVILAGAWVLRSKGWLRAAQGQSIKLAGTQSLGGRAYVSIVEVEDARLVIGVTGNQVTLLHTMPPSPKPGLKPADHTPAEPISFAGSLTRVLSRRRA
jgi:flagellar protein FliO/FliZ